MICVAKKYPFEKGKSEKIYNAGTSFERLQIDILGPFPVSSSGCDGIAIVTHAMLCALSARALSVRALDSSGAKISHATIFTSLKIKHFKQQMSYFLVREIRLYRV